jgi:hypothetical protein
MCFSGRLASIPEDDRISQIAALHAALNLKIEMIGLFHEIETLLTRQKPAAARAISLNELPADRESSRRCCRHRHPPFPIIEMMMVQYHGISCSRQRRGKGQGISL